MISCNIFCSIVDLILVLTGLELASGKGTKDILPLLMSSSLLLQYWSQFYFIYYVVLMVSMWLLVDQMVQFIFGKH